MNKKETETRGEAKGMPLTVKGRRVTKDYLIEHGIIKDYFTPAEEEKSEDCVYKELIRINLNESIKVKLTDWGKEIYYHQYDKVNQIAGREICKPSFPKEDENGYTEFQLWDFIQLYGIHIGMTLPDVIKPFEIVYEGELINEMDS